MNLQESYLFKSIALICKCLRAPGSSVTNDGTSHKEQLTKVLKVQGPHFAVFGPGLRNSFGGPGECCNVSPLHGVCGPAA